MRMSDRARRKGGWVIRHAGRTVKGVEEEANEGYGLQKP